VIVGGKVRAAVKRLRAAIMRYRWSVWERDRAELGGWADFRTRVARIATWSVRGVFARRLSTEAAALAYYTIFSIVPVLVLVLWALKATNVIAYLTPAAADMPVLQDAGADVSSHDHNVLLREAVLAVLKAVDRAGTLQTGLAGLAVLLYAVIRLVVHMEGALDSIAGARERPARYRRMLGPPATGACSGLWRCSCCRRRCCWCRACSGCWRSCRSAIRSRH
jgi:hypothetical protein